MDLLEHLRRLFVYDFWANREVLRAFETMGNPPERSLRLLGHIIGAESLWMARLKQETSPIEVWPMLFPPDCGHYLDGLEAAWTTYLHDLTLSRLGDPIYYVNSKGEPWSSTIGDVLTHVTVHSAYHRGQIAANLRDHGHTPPYTDFIHAVRRGLVKT